MFCLVRGRLRTREGDNMYTYIHTLFLILCVQLEGFLNEEQGKALTFLEYMYK